MQEHLPSASQFFSFYQLLLGFCVICGWGWSRSFFCPYWSAPLQVDCSGYELEHLHTKVTSLCSRIEQIPCYSAKDRLAQSGKLWALLSCDLLPVFITASPVLCGQHSLWFFSLDMAKRVANLLRVVLSLQHAPDATSNSTPDPQRVPLRLLAPHIGRLPMPEDYALEELRGLTQSYLRELTVGSQWAQLFVTLMCTHSLPSASQHCSSWHCLPISG